MVFEVTFFVSIVSAVLAFFLVISLCSSPLNSFSVLDVSFGVMDVFFRRDRYFLYVVLDTLPSRTRGSRLER